MADKVNKQRDPFAVDPLPRPHYHPSPERPVKARQKYIVGRPPLEKTRDKHDVPNKDRLSPMDELFLKGSNLYQTHTDNMTDDVNFDESWPTSEKPSSLSLSGIEDEGPVDIQRYQATLDKFVAFKNTLNTVDKQGKTAATERLRKPGSSSQSSGIGKGTRKTGSSVVTKIPVRNKITGKSSSKGKLESQTENGPGSTLQRYIDRFRNSAPMSREEREKLQAGSTEDFWWMTDQKRELVPSDCSTPREPDNIESKSWGITPLTEENLDKYTSFKGEKTSKFKDWCDSPDHKRTVELQEKAEKLLERSGLSVKSSSENSPRNLDNPPETLKKEKKWSYMQDVLNPFPFNHSSSTVVSTDPAVSTDGLGSNLSDMSSLDEYPYKPPFAKYTDKQITSKHSKEFGPGYIPRTTVHPSRPEEDPLYQWRLRRRMEQAKEAAPVNVGSFGFMTKTEQQKKIDAKLDEFKQRLAGKEVQAPPTRVKIQQPLANTDEPNNIEMLGTHPTLSARLQFTPAPTQHTADVQPTTPIQTADIASPTLHRRRPRSHDTQPVDPHLHLMCDLLPCPHQGQYTDKLQTDAKAQENYRQYLQAEKPDVETLDIAQEIVGKANVTEFTDRNQKRDTDNQRKHKQEKVHFVNNQDHFIESEDDNSQCKGVTSKKIKPVGNKGDKVTEMLNIEDNEDNTEGQIKTRNEGKINVIKPTSSSSPKLGRKTIDSAIGQAVKDHLFSTTTSTVLSSVDSLPTTQSVDKFDNRKQDKYQESHTKDEDYESDGEFVDDHLLKMLRSQRTLYEKQLQQIDEKLKSLDGR